MNKNSTIVGEQTMEAILEGVNAVADVVSVTYGGGGNNVILLQPQMAPLITNDGVTVARHFPGEHSARGAGISLIKQVAVSTETKAGDSTTTSVVLAQALANHAYTTIKDKNLNRVQFKRGMDMAMEEVEKILHTHSHQNVSDDLLRNICRVSVNGDEEVTDILTDTFIEAGKSLGTIRIETGASERTIVDYTKGSQIDSGYLKASYINNYIEGTVNSVGECNIVLIEGDLNFPEDFNKVLGLVTKSPVMSTLVIMAEGFSPQVLEYIYRVNSEQNSILFLPVRFHSFGDDRASIIKDYEALTGAGAVKRDLSNLGETPYGSCVRVSQDGNRTIIELTDEQLNSQEVEDRVTLLKDMVDNQGERMTPGSLKAIKERISNLSKGIATIFVGGASEVEIREKADRYRDALNSLVASDREGIVIGSGVALLQAQEILTEVGHKIKFSNDSVKYGYWTVLECLSEPLTRILTNIQHDNIEGVIDYIRDSEYTVVYDVVDDIYRGDLYITDPLKMVTVSAKNAVSVVGTFLTTGSIVLNNEGLFSQNR